MTTEPSLRILVVDDSLVMIHVVESYVKKQLPQSVCERAQNGQEALERWKEGSFDMIILDLQMPDKSGLEVLEEIRSHDKKLPIVIYSANQNAATLKRCRELGSYYVDKCDTTLASVVLEAANHILLDRSA